MEIIMIGNQLSVSYVLKENRVILLSLDLLHAVGDNLHQKVIVSCVIEVIIKILLEVLLVFLALLEAIVLILNNHQYHALLESIKILKTVLNVFFAIGEVTIHKQAKQVVNNVL